MKAIVLLFLSLVMTGCHFYVAEDNALSCGYLETPYLHEPYYQEHSSYKYGSSACFKWRVDDYYGVCEETWCYYEDICAWELQTYTCYPI